MGEESIFFHIDVNSAFLSWSALKALEEGSTVDLREIPSIVGGDQKTRHGIVVAKSIPAKAYGIQTAEPVASALRKCPGLVMVPPDSAYYKEKSHALMDHLREICPIIEQVSIDECYMLFDPIAERYDSPLAAATKIKDDVYQKFGFTVNVGISDRKVLAKVASDFKKPNLVHTLFHTEIQEKLWPLPIGELHMCGKSSAQTLRRVGIRTVGDLANADLQMVLSLLKSHGQLLYNYANGIDDSTVVTEHAKAKGIGNSTTVAKDLTQIAEVCPVLAKLCKSVATRMEREAVVAGQLSVEIKYADFHSVSHQAAFASATGDYQQIYLLSLQLFKELWDESPIRLLGVRATKLEDAEAPRQMNLFDYQRETQQQEKDKRLTDAVDTIRKRYGDGAISKGFGAKP